jgi:hypothetical protein
MLMPADSSVEGSSNRRAREFLSPGLASFARRAPVSSGQVAGDEESERVLKAAVEALLPLVRRTPGCDITITVNQAPVRAARIHYTHEGLVAHRLNGRGRTAGHEGTAPVFNESEVVSELASMLLSGEVEPR